MNRKRKVAYLVAIIIIGMLSGILDVVLYRSELLSIAQICEMLALAFFALMWVNADSAERSIKTSWGLRAAIVLVGVIAVPYYLVKSRGIRGIAAIVGAAALFGSVCAAYYAGWHAALRVLYNR